MDITTLAATLAAWGEFLGGIAVVASLLYLASQIRQNSRQMRAATASATSQIVFQDNALIAQDHPDLNRIYWDGLSAPDSLSEADRRRFDPLLATVMESNRQLLRFARDGLVSPEVWEEQEKGMRWFAQQPGFQQWWARWLGNFGGDCVKTFDDLIREGEGAGCANYAPPRSDASPARPRAPIGRPRAVVRTQSALYRCLLVSRSFR
jgi:hypothetical protein